MSKGTWYNKTINITDKIKKRKEDQCQKKKGENSHRNLNIK